MRGRTNLITDVPGLTIGQIADEKLRSGVTAILFDEPAVAAVDVRGGAPGTSETDLLALENTVEAVDAVALSGGSAFGLEAVSGVRAWLAAQGRGFSMRGIRVPIVPSAILFDLANDGDKAWGRFSPYRDMGFAAAEAAGCDMALGSVGAGFGARTATLRGGLGSASAVDPESGIIVGAIAAVNSVGSATLGNGPHFWAAPFEEEDEFGGLGLPSPIPPDARAVRLKGALRENTTIALVATDAILTKPQAKRLAIMAQDGLARALHPAHTPLDGDAVFAASTGRRPLPEPVTALARIGTLAGLALARAVARGVYEAASSEGFPGLPPAWRDVFSRRG